MVVGLQGLDGTWLNPRKHDLLSWRQNFAACLEQRGLSAEATPAYSRGREKGNYRRDLAELEQRGIRQRPDPSPSHDADLEARAIEQRAEAWIRLAAHYAALGDREAETAIRAYVADHYDYHPTPYRSDPDRER